MHAGCGTTVELNESIGLLLLEVSFLRRRELCRCGKKKGLTDQLLFAVHRFPDLFVAGKLARVESRIERVERGHIGFTGKERLRTVDRLGEQPVEHRLVTGTVAFVCEFVDAFELTVEIVVDLLQSRDGWRGHRHVDARSNGGRFGCGFNCPY